MRAAGRPRAARRDPGRVRDGLVVVPRVDVGGGAGRAARVPRGRRGRPGTGAGGPVGARGRRRTHGALGTAARLAGALLRGHGRALAGRVRLRDVPLGLRVRHRGAPGPDRFYNRPLVFEIGNSLREARVRQALDFPEIEQATKIRGKYLRALEDENFEQLPGQTYVKGFLRTYADYLGLEGQLYVDEYNSRYVAAGEEEAPVRFRGGGAMPGSTRLMSSAVLIALTAIAVAAALVIVAWKFGGNRGVVDVGNDKPAAKQKPHRTKPHKQAPSTQTDVRLVVRATKGNSYVEVHKGNSPAGEVVYQGTLEHGDHQVFTQRHLWVRIDSPRNVVVKLNGLRKPLGGSRPIDLALTNRGLKTVT